VYGREVRFGPPVTPPVIKNVMIANVVVFLAQTFVPEVTRFGAVAPEAVWQRGAFWQPFTYMWLHGGPLHIAVNMFALWMFGSTLAMAWGEQRFLRYYLTCGFGAGFLIATIPYAVYFLGMDPGNLSIPTLGASGAVYGVLLAFSFTWPDRTIMLIFPPIPLKAIWLIPFLFLMDYFYGPPNVSTVGHLGGAIIGWIYLVNEGKTPGAPTLQNLRHRFRRYRMRQKLRAVRDEEERDRRRRWNDDRPRYH